MASKRNMTTKENDDIEILIDSPDNEPTNFSTPKVTKTEGEENATAVVKVEKKMTLIVSSITFYVLISLATVFVNKFILSHAKHKFNYPLTMTMFQVFCAFVYMLILCPLVTRIPPLQSLLNLPKFELRLDRIIAVIPLAFIFVGMIALNNACLSFVDVTLYLVFRSLTILFSVVLSYFILDQKTKLLTIGAIIVVVIGYFVGSFGGFKENSYSFQTVLYGAIAGTCSSIFVAMNSIMNKKVLGTFDNNHWILLIYVNFVSFFLFLIVVLVFEMREVVTFEYFFEWDFILFLNLSSICGFLINISITLILKFTTPLTKEITATAKACLQPIFGALLFKDSLNVYTIIGALVCVVGSFLYTLTRYFAK